MSRGIPNDMPKATHTIDNFGTVNLDEDDFCLIFSGRGGRMISVITDGYLYNDDEEISDMNNYDTIQACYQFPGPVYVVRDGRLTDVDDRYFYALVTEPFTGGSFSTICSHMDDTRNMSTDYRLLILWLANKDSDELFAQASSLGYISPKKYGYGSITFSKGLDGLERIPKGRNFTITVMSDHYGEDLEISPR